MANLAIFVIAALAFMVTSGDANGVCRPTPFLISATSADRNRNFDSSAPIPLCEKGPVQKIWTLRGEFYWPPIYRGSCDGLRCRDPPCIARKIIWRTRCVLVYRFIKGHWKKIGFQFRRYLDHLKCSCKRCEDIKNKFTCIRTKPCPNSNFKDSFCYWRFPFIGKIGRCFCCRPFPCPKPKIFSRSRCTCVCPKGTKEVHGKCVGDCNDVSIRICPFVTCADNPQFKCQRRFVHKKLVCVCPSCNAARNIPVCLKTNCLEQKGNPRCVYDFKFRKCRCPQCSDRKDAKSCFLTFCGFNNKFQCRYDFKKRRCFCPHYD